MKYNSEKIINISKLLKECCKGSEKSWKIFINEFHPLISAAVEKICKSDADDITQTVYEKLIKDNYRLLDHFDGCYEQFLIYLKNISRNTALSYLKKLAVISQHTVDLDTFITNLADTNINMETKFLKEEEISTFKEVIYQLDAKYQEIILFLCKGYKYQDISDMIGIPINTCLTRASRAKDILRKILEKNEIKMFQ